MSQQRIYKQATIHGVRIGDLRHLWTPSTDYQGKKQEKPSYFSSLLVRKTTGNWTQEPVLNDFARACSELFQLYPYLQEWAVKDGDVPAPGKASPAEWMRGHWLISGSSSQPITVNIVQNGNAVPLANRVGVKSGDVVSAGVALAVKQNDPRAVKVYLNSVLFMAPGEEIVLGNTVSGAELMAQAKAQGLNVTGFGAPQQPGGFMGGQGGPGMLPGGFAPPPGGQPVPQPPQMTPQGYRAPMPIQPPQMTPQGYPTPGNLQPAFGGQPAASPGFGPANASMEVPAAPAPNGMQPGGAGYAAPPFNGGFVPPSGFAPPSRQY